MKKESKNILQAVQHLLTGLFLLLKGYDKIGHHYYLIGYSIVSFGALIIIYFIYERKTHKQSRTLKLLVHFFEGLALVFTAYVYYEDGKTYLPYVTLAAAIGFLIAFIVHLKHHKAISKKV